MGRAGSWGSVDPIRVGHVGTPVGDRERSVSGIHGGNNRVRPVSSLVEIGDELRPRIHHVADLNIPVQLVERAKRWQFDEPPDRIRVPSLARAIDHDGGCRGQALQQERVVARVAAVVRHLIQIHAAYLIRRADQLARNGPREIGQIHEIEVAKLQENGDAAAVLGAVLRRRRRDTGRIRQPFPVEDAGIRRNDAQDWCRRSTAAFEVDGEAWGDRDGAIADCLAVGGVAGVKLLVFFHLRHRAVVVAAADWHESGEVGHTAVMIHVIVGRDQVIDTRHPRACHRRLNATRVAAIDVRPSRVHQYAFAGGSHDQRRPSALDIDEVKFERPASTLRLGYLVTDQDADQDGQKRRDWSGIGPQSLHARRNRSACHDVTAGVRRRTRPTRTLTAIRVLLGVIFFSSGMGKLTHGDYESVIGPVWLIERLAPYGLGLWATFVAWFQVLIGLMLFSRRFAILGAIMLVPMLANIFVVTISLGWRGTPWVNAALLGLNLVLLIADRERLLTLIADRVESPALGAAAAKVTIDARDTVWLVTVVLCVAGALLHPVSRWLTFGLSGTGLLAHVLASVRSSSASRLSLER